MYGSEKVKVFCVLVEKMNYNAYYAAAGAPPSAPDKPAAMYPGQGVLSASPPGSMAPAYPQQVLSANTGSAVLARPPAAYPSHIPAQPGYPSPMYHQSALPASASPYGPAAGLYAAPASSLAMPQPSHAGMPTVLANGPYAGAAISQASPMGAHTMSSSTHGMYPYPTYSVSPAQAAQLPGAPRAPGIPGYPPSQPMHAPMSSYPAGVTMTGTPYGMVSASPYHRPVP